MRCTICMSLLIYFVLTTSTTSFRPTSQGRRVQWKALQARKGSSSNNSRQNRIDNLVEWSKSVEIQTKNIQLNSDPTSGLGWKTAETAGNNDVVLLIPSAQVLTVSDGGGPDDPEVLRMGNDRSDLRKLPWYAQFSLYLHYLKLNKLKTPWLDSLPNQLDTVWHWSKDERVELQYAPLIEAVERQETQWKALFNKVKDAGVNTMDWSDDFVWGCEMARSRAFSSNTPPAFNPAIYAFTLVLVLGYVALGLGTIEQAANGAGVVLSVSILNDFVVPKLFPSGKSYCICPMIDMTNHDTSPNANVSFEYFANAYSLATTLAIRKGEPVLISYGDRSNDQLLQYYGFCLANNPHDVYLLPALSEWDIGAMEKATGRSVQSGRLEKLQRAGLLGGRLISGDDDDDDDEEAENARGGVVVTKNDGIDPAVLQALRALMSSPQEWQDAGEAVGNFSTKLSEANEAVAKLAAKTILQMELDNKPTTLAQDEKLLGTTTTMTDGGSPGRLALEFRIAKKKLLQASIDRLR